MIQNNNSIHITPKTTKRKFMTQQVSPNASDDRISEEPDIEIDTCSDGKDF